MSNMRLANVKNWSDICKSVSKTDETDLEDNSLLSVILLLVV